MNPQQYCPCTARSVDRITRICACLTAVVLLGMGQGAWAQDMSTDERVKLLEERLERIQELVRQSDAVDIRSVGPSYQPTRRYSGLGLVNRVMQAVREYF